MMYQPYTWRQKLYHFLNGVWSGIPVCCVAYWCKGFHGLNRDIPDPHYRETYYIRCNHCAAERHITTIRNNGRVAAWLLGS